MATENHPLKASVPSDDQQRRESEDILERIQAEELADCPDVDPEHVPLAARVEVRGR